MTTDKKLVLAYSGGLDTSFCVVHLVEKGFSVHALHVNTGGFSADETADIKKRAIEMGVSSFKSVNNESTYFDKCIRYLIYGNVLRNQTYPLSVSSERVFQAIEVLKHVRKLGATYVAHGSTGAGNDQVRFDLVFDSLGDEIDIITPIRDLGLSRTDEIDYLVQKGFRWDSARAAYSINQGLWGTSVGGAETLGSRLPLPDSAFPHQCTEKESVPMSITFEKGIPTAIDDRTYDNPVELIRALNTLGHRYAIGRDIHVGDTIIGIKGRVGFEAPAALMLIKGHQLLEKHTLSKWQMYWKNQLAEWYGMELHEGRYFEPVMRQIEGFLADSQHSVTGKVFFSLHPYRFQLEGIESPFDLMNTSFGKYGEENRAWTGDDVRGFTKISANAEKIYYQINQAQKPL